MGDVSTAEAARRLGVDQGTIARTRKEFDLPMPPSPSVAAAARHAEIAEQLRPLAHLTNTQAARALHLSETMVRNVRREYTLPHRRRAPLTAEHKQRIAEGIRRARDGAAEARVPPPVKRSEGGRPTPAQIAKVQRMIDRGEFVARWSCSVCGGTARWPVRPPGWWGNPPAVALKCPCCRPPGQPVPEAGDR
jgi:hypothetical protein